MIKMNKNAQNFQNFQTAGLRLLCALGTVCLSFACLSARGDASVATVMNGGPCPTTILYRVKCPNESWSPIYGYGTCGYTCYSQDIGAGQTVILTFGCYNPAYTPQIQIVSGCNLYDAANSSAYVD